MSKLVVPLSLSLAIAVALSGCQMSAPAASSATPVNKMPDTQPSCGQDENTNKDVLAAIALGENVWNECLNHNTAVFEEVLGKLETAVTTKNLPQLDTYLYYLRAYSYFGNLEDIAPTQWSALDKVLTAIANMDAFKLSDDKARRLQEHFAVTLYRFYYQEALFPMLAPQLNNLTELLNSFESLDVASLSTQSQYTLWEVYRAIAFLAYEGRGNDLVKASYQSQALIKGLMQQLARVSEASWPLDHLLWNLAYIQQLQDEKVGKEMDAEVWSQLGKYSFLNEDSVKRHFTLNYLVNSFRAKDSCEESFVGQCVIPEIDESLPINHQCSPSLFIRANEMSKEQLETSCAKLIGQEDDFHHKLATNREPVPNDFNQSLRVVIFDNYSQYNRYGQTTFNIQTNNGGMYIEGKPSKPGNQATFFSFEAFWQRPDFSVWNLEHEYVHYLDGRFVKYDGFGHFPSHLVWWSEGLAEYISKVDDNKKAFALLVENEQKDWPSLADIFATTYADGSKRVYQWSYLAIRFIYEHYPEKLRGLKHFLKTDYFDGYKALLDEISSQHQAEFLIWMKKHYQLAKAEKIEEKQSGGTINRKIYRYLYRDYLYPQSLPLSQDHQHNI